MTGDWEAGQARDAQNPGLAPMQDDEGADDDGEVFGDFEDVELGVQHAGGSSDPVTQAAMQVTNRLFMYSCSCKCERLQCRGLSVCSGVCLGCVKAAQRVSSGDDQGMPAFQSGMSAPSYS